MNGIGDIFKIGIGPSSSHTVGPMKAARAFAQELELRGLLERVARIQTELFGSLALTGKGHATDRAVILGLCGERPESVDPDLVEAIIATVTGEQTLNVLGRKRLEFIDVRDLLFLRDRRLDAHSNAMRLSAFDAQGDVLQTDVYYSIGGGFIQREGEVLAHTSEVELPYPFRSGAELFAIAALERLDVWQIVLANETKCHGDGSARATFERIWETMRVCVERGLSTEGVLPGGLKVNRRAAKLAQRLREGGQGDPMVALDWVNVFAMAVNEENAAGGRVVTAPTNGASGVIPAVAHYYERFIADADTDGLFRFFLTATAIGSLYKDNASISGSEVGCQGEFGVATSMAAAGLVAALNGTSKQIEYAAEIGMEHSLGMTCDPVGGLVQIPCIERNAMGAVKAINASRIAMRETSELKVSLDQVIKTMHQTGLDMQSRYKETSLAGLALNVIEC